MQQTELTTQSGTGFTTGLGKTGRRRVETVVETLATLHGGGETVAEVAHDARNMVTALCLYCELLDEPGVLAPQFRHYGNELRLVAAASRRLVEKLILLDARTLDARSLDAPNPASRELDPRNANPASPSAAPAIALSEAAAFDRAAGWDLLPAAPIRNLAREVLASRNLLSALAGPSIALTADAEGGALPVPLSGEDLTRVLVNLVRNAAEAMPAGGRIRIALREQSAGGAAEALALTIADNGPGIPADKLEAVFASGYTAHTVPGGQPDSHRGLGLAISRSIIEAAGGSIHALRQGSSGACLQILLPVASR